MAVSIAVTAAWQAERVDKTYESLEDEMQLVADAAHKVVEDTTAICTALRTRIEKMIETDPEGKEGYPEEGYLGWGEMCHYCQ